MISRGIFFTGETMSGKTHLAVAILRELFHRFHEDILFASFDDLVPFHRSLARGSRPSPIWERLKTVSLLVLDGLGSASCNSEVLELIQELIHARSGAKTKTIYTGRTVHPNGLFSPLRNRPNSASETHELIASLPSHTSIRLLMGVRILKVHGKDVEVNESWKKKLVLMPGF
jgi:hypothetical protein